MVAGLDPPTQVAEVACWSGIVCVLADGFVCPRAQVSPQCIEMTQHRQGEAGPVLRSAQMTEPRREMMVLDQEVPNVFGMVIDL